MPIVLAASDLVAVRPGLIFWTLVTFILVALLLRRVAWGPILKVVDEREKTIAASIESAARSPHSSIKVSTPRSWNGGSRPCTSWRPPS